MSDDVTPSINVMHIARVMKAIIPEWRTVAAEHSEEGASKRDQLIALNERLSDAFYRSDYTRRHIDWDYAVQLIHAVLEEDHSDDACTFADKLNAAVVATATDRDVVAVIPLGFSTGLAPFHRQPAVRKALSLGPFSLCRQASSAASLSNLLAPHGAAAIAVSDYSHHVTQSHEALRTYPLLIFESHGSNDAIRFQMMRNIRRLTWLIELLGRVYETGRPFPFGREAVSHHGFVVNKSSGQLSRFPLQISPTVSLPLTTLLLRTMRRPELNSFMELLGSDGKNLVQSLRNSLTFFGRAIAQSDQLTRFLFFVISMEAILSRDKSAPIKMTLADHATILCFDPEHRQAVHADLQTIYDVRSGIVHGGSSRVEPRLLAMAEKLAVRVIYCSLSLAASVKSEEGTLDKRFYGHLLEMKIGTRSRRIKLPPWRGCASSEDEDLDAD